METVLMQTDSKKYNVVIGVNALAELKPFLTTYFDQLTKILIITDEHVANLHLSKLIDSLEELNHVVFIAPNGEKAKTFEVYYNALTVALENHLDRKSVILTFGGGAVGDLGGFVASTFMRGIPFIQVPTTILAHDSAVGGKVAINHPSGKNMIGAFHQPEAVFYDLSFLETLPQREIRSGFAEVIKHALIQDPDFYRWLVTNVADFYSLKMEHLHYALTKGVKIKREFVSKDERENGVRAYLNFGHTLGHAIESEMGFGNMTHGEGVMIGMVFALQLSKNLLGLSFQIDEFIQWIQKLGYITEIPLNLGVDPLLKTMKQDKKSIGETIRFVLLEQIGIPKMQEITDEILTEQLSMYNEQRGECNDQRGEGSYNG
ncbi:3-dehydroquinate synthase [Neobacillus sp. PS3-40]|uniref:3-dehydroquinate synthase n=1 Tax=Neobacillus sp. PS3-40 TaxID=3070679 RepID=UPI0027DF78EF|nr:3-dehydroquinate synthase [Neobacillus sp. PS3-40]WML45109.1 3-dehydroquinate synthase [Neobacillus sp. PS3-40]